MNFNFKNTIDSKNDDLSNEEKRIKALKVLAKYMIIFAVLLIIIYFNKSSTTNNTHKNLPAKENLPSLFEKVKDNYQAKVEINADEDILSVEFQKDGNKELISRIYKESVNNYYKYNDDYYEVDLENKRHLKKDKVKIYNDYDMTFLNILNIGKIIATVPEENSQNLEYNIVRYTLLLSNMINIYNEINNTEFNLNNDEEVVIDIKYNFNNIESIIIDMTKIHNMVKNTSYNKLIYTIIYSEINNIDLSSINVD